MNLIFKKILGYIVIITGIVTYLFFQNYSGNLFPYPIFGKSVGILLLVVGVFILRIIWVTNKKRECKNPQTEIDDFKSKAEKMLVNLDDCKIIMNNYSEYVDAIESNSELIFDSNKKNENRNVNQAVLIFEKIENGETEKYTSQTIYTDEMTLRLLLNKQKETYIYIDKNNRKRYYFDIDFIHE
jgi:hypothetical protein